MSCEVLCKSVLGKFFSTENSFMKTLYLHEKKKCFELLLHITKSDCGKLVD